MTHAVVLIIATVLGLALAERQPGSASASAAVSYEDFMRTPADQRTRRFAALPPDSRAAIMKQHFEAWLLVHQPDLSRRQESVVREAIAFITPELYGVAPDARKAEEQARLGERLSCALGEDLAATLTQWSSAPQRLRRTWRQSARNWVDWVVNCVV